MPPIVGFIGGVIGAIGTALGAISAFAIGGIAVGRILLTVGLNLIMGALFAPKKASVAERQAQTLDLTLGESPREAIFGIAATGGVLLDGWNDGAKNDYETMVIRLADHECDAVIGYYVNDKYYDLNKQGAQDDHPDFVDPRFNSVGLWIETRNGAPNQTLAPIIAAQGVSSGEFAATDKFAGMCYAVARYVISEKVWSAGRPRFIWVVRGLKCYDPRLDSTVSGGSGPQRWGQPTTYAFSENARVCHYNYVRGVWNYAATPAQLMVGPGRSAEEAPPDLMIADANLCDEDVTLKAGGTEKRYTASAVVKADERWIDVEEHFAAAMAGQLVERGGTIGVDPGAAKSVAFTFTDDQLLAGKEMAYQGKVGRAKLTNTVVARYVDPTQLWQQASAAMRRSQTDIDTDGEPREETVDLVFVTSETQAQRCAEVIRRKARLQPSAVVALGPKYMQLEDADWGEWTSARRFGGGTRTFEVQGVNLDELGNIVVAIKEIASSVFAWNPATDELDKAAPAYLPSAAPATAEIENFDAVAHQITGASGSAAGGILTTWDAITDPSITFVQIEYRPKGYLTSSILRATPSDGQKLIDVLPLVDVDYEVRATPITQPERDTLTTAWIDVTLSAPFTTPIPPANFNGYQVGDQIRFVWTAFLDTTLQYEIRAGIDFERGRFVDRVYGGATVVNWPLSGITDDTLFWIKTLHRSGVYSDQASLWVATYTPTLTNIILTEDYQDNDFPGVTHDMTLDTGYSSPTHQLELNQSGGLSLGRGDYYASLHLASSFTARAWMEYHVNAYDAGSPPTVHIPTPIGTALDAFISIAGAADPATLIEGWRFNDTLTGKKGTTPTTQHISGYLPGKLANGVNIDIATDYLTYAKAAGSEFTVMFDMRMQDGNYSAPDNPYDWVKLTVGNEFLRFYWSGASFGNKFFLEGYWGPVLPLDFPLEASDTISVAIWQNATQRGAVIASRKHPTPVSGSVVLLE